MLEPSLAEWEQLAHQKKMTDLEEVPEPDKVIDPNDLALYEKTKLTLHDLEVEIKTISGFVLDVLNTKYKFESQEEFNKYFK